MTSPHNPTGNWADVPGATPNMDRFSVEVQGHILRSYQRSQQQRADAERRTA